MSFWGIIKISSTQSASLLKPKRSTLLCLAALLVAWLWFTAPLLTGQRTVAFRDASSFYYPLFAWTADQWSQGRVPLWNPQDNGGTPVVGDASASVFYPGKLIFTLPLPFALRYNLYVAGHLLLAAVASFWVARRYGFSAAAAALAAASFSFGGHILAQTSNVVFLVGAAWLPFAWLAMDRLLFAKRTTAAIAGLATALAMMILGGDPQLALHTIVLGSVAALCFRRSKYSTRLRRLSLLAVATLCALLLSAVQVLPSRTWSANSERKLHDTPRSLWQIPAWMNEHPDVSATSVVTGLAASANPGTHDHQIYVFSVAPWRWGELLWSNYGGGWWPTNHRWMSGIAAEGRVWSPSLYMGLLPVVLAAAVFRLRGGTRRRRFWSAALVWSVAASLGWYGIGWIVGEIIRLTSGDLPQVNPAAGGAYWWMVVLFPDYDTFRYPAKWWTVAAWLIALMSARGFDVAVRNPKRIAQWLMVVAWTSAILLVLSLVLRGSLQAGWQGMADSFFGPLQTDKASAVLSWSLLHALICAIGIAWLAKTERPYRRVLWLWLCVIELMLANHAQLPTVPSDLMRTPVTALEVAAESPFIRVYRPATRRWLPSRFAIEADAHRLQDAVKFDRESRYGKHFLTEPLSLVGSENSLIPADMFYALQYQATEIDGMLYPSETLQRLLQIHGQLQPADDDPTGGVRVSEEVEFQPLQVPREPAWIVHRVEVQPPVQTRDRNRFQQQTARVLDAVDQRTAVIEASDIDRVKPAGAANRRADLQQHNHSPTRWVVDIETDAPGLLVASSRYAKGWQALIERPDGTRRPVKVHRTNRLLMGVLVPSGKSQVTFTYRPWDVYLGGVVSGVSWALLGVWWWRRRK